MKRIFALIGFLCLFEFSALQAQEVWTLDKCVQYAYENNISIKQQELNTRYAENTLEQNRASVLPTLNGNAMQNLSYGRRVDPFTNEFTENNVASTSFSLSSSVTLFNGLQQHNTVKKSRLDLKASLQDLEKMKNDIALNIATAYLQILYNQEMLAKAKRQLEVTRQQIARTQKLVEAGSLAKGDLLEIKAQAANEELQVINAQNQLQSSYLTLTQLLALPAGQNFEIERPDFQNFQPESTLPTIEEVFQQAQQLPQIKGAEYRLESSEKSLLIAKGARSPRLSVSASYGTGYSDAREKYSYEMGEPQQAGYVVDATNTPTGEMVMTPTLNTVGELYPFADQLADNASTSVSFQLTIPIFNGLQIKNGVSNARVEVLNSQYNLDLAKQQLYQEIQQAHNDALAALAQYNGSITTLEAMQESFKYTEQRFNVGLVTSVDYNTAKNQLSNTESELLQAKYEYIFKRNVLNFYSGTPLTLD